jgi:hypothetical protein
VNADQAFNSVAPVDLEASDVLDYVSDQTTITYQLGMGSQWQDGFDFAYPVGTNVCFGVDKPAGTAVLVGPTRTPVNVPFDLKTLQPC